MKCNICGQENGSCNIYELRTGEKIIICPSCLMWDTGLRATLARQAQGIAAAKARGVKFGRPRKELPPNFYEMARRWHAGEISCTEAAQQCKMPLEAFRCRVYRGMGSKTSKTEFVARVLLGIERSGKNED